MIDEQHPKYAERLPQWNRCRVTSDGEDAVKAAGKAYLPELNSQSEKSYNGYRQRASFFNAVKRTADGLVGAVMRVDPVVDGLSDEWLNDITGTGVSLKSFISYMLSEQLLMGRQGVLVDYSDRPYLTGYTTEQITNWFDGRVILREEHRVTDAKDIYRSEYQTRYRELLVEDGSYIVRVWENDGKKWAITEEIKPTMRGDGLLNIPFVGVSVDGANLSPETPPLLALADMNLSHYRTSADLEHGRHFTALPTPYIIGVEASAEIPLGAETAWAIPNESAQVGFLEFSGTGLASLEKAMEEKRSMMASLGAQLIEGQKNGVEASGTLRLRQNSEMSVLMSAVKVVEAGINNAVNQMSEWNGEGEISIKLNTDFADTKINNQDMTALMQAWQTGSISHDTFLYNMKRGEVLPEGVSIEDEKAMIELQTTGE